MAHRTGIARVAAAFCQASTLVVQERFDPEETVRLLEKEKATHIGLVPTIANMLLPEIKNVPKLVNHFGACLPPVRFSR